ncbi:MAG: class I SAM-dependent methyltransferase [Coleofasciculaceae cyanobacterium]
MNVFGNYARYYDLLYRDKDYAGEAKFIVNLLQTHAPTSQFILELGCGTGTLASLLVKERYNVCGVDLSASMLQQASDQLFQLPQELKERLNFLQGDLRTICLGQQFDAIISVFHVFSYQISNEDLAAAFATVKRHLKPGGVFIFDCWYGPAVLSDRPSIKIKRLEDQESKITRIAEPIAYPNLNLVDVNYQVLIENKNTSTIEELKETHRMRYLFQPEIEKLLTDENLQLICSGEWMTNREIGFDTWGVYFVIRG